MVATRVGVSVRRVIYQDPETGITYTKQTAVSRATIR